jgi:excisionase family DNA binding protein
MATEVCEGLFADGSVTISGLKSEYGISRSVAYELMGQGRLPFTQLGRKRLVPRVAVARLLAEGLVGDGAGGVGK